MTRPSASRLLALFGVLAVAVLLPSRAHAGAWTKEPGHFFLQIGENYSFAASEYNGNGDTVPIQVRKFSPSAGDPLATSISNIQLLNTNLYVELGLFERVTFFGSLPFVSERQLNPGGDLSYHNNALGDSTIGLRFGLLQTSELALAIETRLGLPTGDSRAVMPTGSGDLRGEIRIAAAHAFKILPLYVGAEFGFTLRGTGTVGDMGTATGTTTVNYSPELALHLEAGATLVKWQHQPRLLLGVAFDYRGSTSKQPGGALNQLTLVPDSSETSALSVSLSWIAYHGFGVSAYFAQVVEGFRVPLVTSLGGGLFVQY